MLSYLLAAGETADTQLAHQSFMSGKLFHVFHTTARNAQNTRIPQTLNHNLQYAESVLQLHLPAPRRAFLKIQNVTADPGLKASP
jgi:hypothetical protein